MFNIGMPELLVIAGLALIILGPEKFPSHAKIALRMFRDFKEHWEDAKREITNELNPVKKEIREFQKFKPEELLDKLTGETDETPKLESAEEAAATAPSNTDGPGYAYADSMEGIPTGANEAPVEFQPNAVPATEGRSETTQWERSGDAETKSTLTEEDEYRAASTDYASRPADGSD